MESSWHILIKKNYNFIEKLQKTPKIGEKCQKWSFLFDIHPSFAKISPKNILYTCLFQNIFFREGSTLNHGKSRGGGHPNLRVKYDRRQPMQHFNSFCEVLSQ
jgi:hypothetical protein